jgi:hypothetical protein
LPALRQADSTRRSGPATARRPRARFQSSPCEDGQSRRAPTPVDSARSGGRPLLVGQPPRSPHSGFRGWSNRAGAALSTSPWSSASGHVCQEMTRLPPPCVSTRSLAERLGAAGRRAVEPWLATPEE